MTTETSEEHLLVVDGLNVVRRVYEANPAPDSPEKAQSAVRKSVASFRRALEEHRPTHVLAPFDYGGPTWRHELYPQYRQKRAPMPQELREVLPDIYEELHTLGIPTIRVPGVEADDVIATVNYRWLETKAGPVTNVSTDKDIAWLASLSKRVRIRDHFKPEWRDDAWVAKKFGVPFALLHDLLALMGDSSDDVPGVPGIAVVKGAKLLNQYGNLDELLKHADEVPGKMGDNLRANIELVHLARKLVAFKTDLSLGLTWKTLRYNT